MRVRFAHQAVLGIVLLCQYMRFRCGPMKGRILLRFFVHMFALAAFLSPCRSLMGQEVDKEQQLFPRFQAHLIDRLPRGYKVGTANIDRDGKLDVIGLATEPSSLVWYKNPSWEKYVLTSRAKEYVDLAPYDIDRDGRMDKRHKPP